MHRIIERYALARDLAPSSIAQLGFALANFAAHLGRDVQPADFTDDNVNRFIVWLAAKKYAHETIRTRRKGIMALWRAEADEGRCEPPRRVRRLPPVHSIPRAWTPAQVATILAECDQLPGAFRNFPAIQRRIFARAFCLVAYETGFRRSDILRLRRAQITDAGLIVIVQSKTGRVHLARVRLETIQAIDLLGTAGRETIFGGIVCNRWLSRIIDAMLERAGIDDGSLKWFRRSGATHVEQQQPGAGWRFLGHTSPRIAAASYIDPLQTGAEPLMPPEPK